MIAAQVLALVLGILPSPSLGAEPLDGASSVLPPCSLPPPVDTTGWRAARLIDTGGWYISFRLPPSFRRDPAARFHHGGEAYVDGRRRLVNGLGYTCAPGLREPGCGECVDTIAGRPFALTTSYGEGLYHVAAGHVFHDSGYPIARGGLHFTSPDSSDQKLFLAILRTLREDSRVADGGVLFLGGHEMTAPIVLKRVRERLTVNRRQMPDLVPPGAREPVINAELEARRTVAARLAALRDSLLQSGMEWPQVLDRLGARALLGPFVKSAESHSPSGAASSLLRISWAFGFDITVIARKGRPLEMGGRRNTLPENERFWAARLDYLKVRLDEGCVLFLLGGGCEYVVDPARAAQARDAARLIANGKTPTPHREPILPEDVEEQLRHPLELDLEP